MTNPQADPKQYIAETIEGWRPWSTQVESLIAAAFLAAHRCNHLCKAPHQFLARYIISRAIQHLITQSVTWRIILSSDPPSVGPEFDMEACPDVRLP